MAIAETSRVVTFTLLCTFPVLFGQGYEIPEVNIVPLKPRGVRISIPDNPNMILFAFHGRVNRYIGDDDIGDISGEVTKPEDGFWKFTDNYVQLKVNDVIYYYVHVIKDKKGYHKSQQKYTVKELYDPHQAPEVTTSPPRIPDPIVPTARPPTSVVPTAPTAGCRPTSTSILSSGFSQSVCSGQVIFEDNFDNLREDLWTVEQYIPSKPEYPFVSYQRPTVSVSNGLLRIEPQLQENFPGFDSAAITYSRLDLTAGCTRPASCVFNSDGGNILPPIASGRVTSKLFSFKYGFVEVRAKVPQGDWLYPEILLESFLSKYGPDNYASGVMRIAGVLGNMILYKGNEEYGNKVLFGGPMMDFKCRNNLLVKKLATTEWGNDFHTYALRWAPDMIALIVDGEEWGRIETPTNGLQSRLPTDTCDLPSRIFLKAPIAPFDDYFRIALGVAAGGVSEFPDGVISLYTISKPWVNTARRARYNFFRAKDTWLPTWTQPTLLIDYVKVRAL